MAERAPLRCRGAASPDDEANPGKGKAAAAPVPQQMNTESTAAEASFASAVFAALERRAALGGAPARCSLTLLRETCPPPPSLKRVADCVAALRALSNDVHVLTDPRGSQCHYVRLARLRLCADEEENVEAALVEHIAATL